MMRGSNIAVRFRPATSAGCIGAAAGALVLTALVAGCSQANSTRLPELASLPRRLLSEEEQKKAVEALKARQETHRAEAIKEIEGEKHR
ncbi:MAG: hypothetical protein KJZ80_01100 [Hyphomicrobiaceae bacterium]|nr:hypothetical protein [Hyphomicrobiaceae bacterium]